MQLPRMYIMSHIVRYSNECTRTSFTVLFQYMLYKKDHRNPDSDGNEDGIGFLKCNNFPVYKSITPRLTP